MPSKETIPAASLAAMLQRMQAERRQRRRIGMPQNAENAALLMQRIAVERIVESGEGMDWFIAAGLLLAKNRDRGSHPASMIPDKMPLSDKSMRSHLPQARAPALNGLRPPQAKLPVDLILRPAQSGRLPPSRDKPVTLLVRWPLCAIVRRGCCVVCRRLFVGRRMFFRRARASRAARSMFCVIARSSGSSACSFAPRISRNGFDLALSTQDGDAAAATSQLKNSNGDDEQRMPRAAPKRKPKRAVERADAAVDDEVGDPHA